MTDFRALVAKKHGVKPEGVSLGAGSGEILENAVQAFTTSTRGLVAAMPTFEAPARIAETRKVPLTEVPVNSDGKLDLEQMIAAASGRLAAACVSVEDSAQIERAAEECGSLAVYDGVLPRSRTFPD